MVAVWFMAGTFIDIDLIYEGMLAITETPPFCDMWWRPILSHGRTCVLSHLREAAGPHWRIVFKRTIPIA